MPCRASTSWCLLGLAWMSLHQSIFFMFTFRWDKSQVAVLIWRRHWVLLFFHVFPCFGSTTKKRGLQTKGSHQGLNTQWMERPRSICVQCRCNVVLIIYSCEMCIVLHLKNTCMNDPIASTVPIYIYIYTLTSRVFESLPRDQINKGVKVRLLYHELAIVDIYSIQLSVSIYCKGLKSWSYRVINCIYESFIHPWNVFSCVLVSWKGCGS